MLKADCIDYTDLRFWAASTVGISGLFQWIEFYMKGFWKWTVIVMKQSVDIGPFTFNRWNQRPFLNDLHIVSIQDHAHSENANSDVVMIISVWIWVQQNVKDLVGKLGVASKRFAVKVPLVKFMSSLFMNFIDSMTHGRWVMRLHESWRASWHFMSH